MCFISRHRKLCDQRKPFTIHPRHSSGAQVQSAREDQRCCYLSLCHWQGKAFWPQQVVLESRLVSFHIFSPSNQSCHIWHMMRLQYLFFVHLFIGEIKSKKKKKEICAKKVCINLCIKKKKKNGAWKKLFQIWFIVILCGGDCLKLGRRLNRIEFLACIQNKGATERNLILVHSLVQLPLNHTSYIPYRLSLSALLWMFSSW